MSERTQHNIGSLTVPLKWLLIVAVAVHLLAQMASWLVGLPAQAAPSATEVTAPTSPSPTPPAVSSPTSLTTLEPTEIPPTATPEPTSTPVPGECVNAIEFLADVTVPDGAVFGLSEPFTKTWRVRNIGSCDWVGYSIVFVDGETMGTLDQAIPDTPAGREVEISVEMTSPGERGSYSSYWQVHSPDGANLGNLTCVIAVKGEDDEPTAEPTPIPVPLPPSEVYEEQWIDVDLTRQTLTAYEGHTPVHTTLVSSGLPSTPTPVGQFRIWIKFRYDDMSGPGYYIEDVPYVMYFYQGYGLHGVTWHGNFGHPMSHGCVNLPTSEAEWLFNWADVGMLVNVHS